MKNLSLILLSLLIWFSAASLASAQNTGGVFPPTVNEGHKSAQYRIAVNTDTDRFAQRLHYQQAINGDFMWRIVGQTRETATSDFDFDYLQAELFWQISPDAQKYQTGLRFDARLRGEDRPEQIGVNWMHQWNLADGWQTRVVALSALQFGNNSNDGVALGVRGRVAKALADGPTIGVESYHSLGSTEKFSLDKNGQTIGPFVSTNLGTVGVMVGAQFGLNDAAADTDLRLWLTKGF